MYTSWRYQLLSALRFSIQSKPVKGMACLCKMAGIDFIIIDRAQGVGGTWWYNRFPGAQVDVFSHTYRQKGP